MRKGIRSLVLWQSASLLFLALALALRPVLEQFQVQEDARFVSLIAVVAAGLIAFISGGLASVFSSNPSSDPELSACKAWLSFTIVPFGCILYMVIEKLDYKGIVVCFMLAVLACLVARTIVEEVGVKIIPALATSTTIFAGSYYFAFRELISRDPSLTNSTIAILIGAFLNTVMYFFVWTGQLKIVWQPSTD